MTFYLEVKLSETFALQSFMLISDYLRGVLSVTKVRVRGQTEAIITRIRRLLCPPSPLVPFSSKEGLSIAGIPISMTNMLVTMPKFW